MTYMPFRKGGGGGSSSTTTSSVRTPDNLRSEDYYEIILGLCEGPIKGLVDGRKSFFFGETVLDNADGTSNFSDVSLDIYPGDLVPTYKIKPVLGGIARSKTVNTQLAQNVAVTRQTQEGLIDHIEVRLLVTQLYMQNDSGIYTASVSFKIEYKPSKSPDWINPFGGNLVVDGKTTTSNVVKEYRWPVQRLADDTYDIRITKLDPDNDNSTVRTMGWESFQEVTVEEPSWPGTAVCHLRGRSSNQFNSIPDIGGVYDLRLIRVPTNYDPVARTYTGAWDGTFKIAWSDNPAWCLYDYVTNSRYGMSSIAPVTMNKYEVYEAGVWCDEIMPNGKPRYTYNDLISEPRSGKEQAMYMAGIFNAIIVDDDEGNMSLLVDKDDQALHLFTRENTVDGFRYSYTDLNTRYNDITVTFTNPDLNWSEDRRRVRDDHDIATNGRVPLDFIAVGCTDVDEAVMRAWYKMVTSLTECEMVTFKTNRFAQFVKPYEIILVSDPKMGYGISGRIKSMNTSRLIMQLRDPVYMEAGIDYQIQVQLPHGLKTINIIGQTTGYNTSLILEDPLPGDVVETAVFTIMEQGSFGAPKPYRVIDITEVDGNPDNIQINAIEVNRNKWYEVANAELQPNVQYSALPDALTVPGPDYCSFYEVFSKQSKEFHLHVEPVLNKGKYKYYSGDFEVWSRPIGGGSYERRAMTATNVIINHPPGKHEFKILPKSLVGGTATLNTVAPYIFDVTNPADPPPDVLWAKANWPTLLWGYDMEPKDFQGFIVRYHLTDKTTWDDAIPAHPGVAFPPFDMGQMSRKVKTVLVKAVDWFGNLSINAAVVKLALQVENPKNVVETHDLKALGWPGTLIGADIILPDNMLEANEVSVSTMYTGVPSASFYSGNGSNHFYGSTYFDVSYETTVTITEPGYMVWDIDIEGSRFHLMYKKSSDAFYTVFPGRQMVDPGVYQVQVIIPGGYQRGRIHGFMISIEVDDISETLRDLVIPVGGLRLPLTKGFRYIEAIDGALQDDGGDAFTWKIIDYDPTGPLIKVYNVAGSETQGTMTLTPRGY